MVDLISVPIPIVTRITKKYEIFRDLPEDKALMRKFPDWKTAKHAQRSVLTNINRPNSPFNFKVVTQLSYKDNFVVLYIMKKRKQENFMPKVWNRKQRDCPKDAVYVGRPSKWGNPFKIGLHGTREQVITKYREHILKCIHDNPSVFDLSELRGKDLACWCHPQPCHADVLLELANK